MSMPSTAGRRYNTAQAFAAASDHNSERGNFVLRPGAADIWKPSYQQNSVMTIRILPVPNPENPAVLDAFRIGSGVGEFGDWMRYYPACRGFGEGNNKATFIIGEPNMDPAELQRSPGHVLFNAVSQRVKAKTDPGWGGFLSGDMGRTADLPKPDGLYLVQAAVLQNNQKMYQPWKGSGQGDKAPVIMLSGGIGKGIRESLEKYKPGYNGDITDYANSLEVGDPISLQHGLFLTIFRKADGNPRTRTGYQQAPASSFGGAPSAQDQRGGPAIGYDFIWESLFMGQVSPSLPGLEAYVRERVQPWDNMINIMTFDEQAHVLAQPGRFPADMLVYAWRDHPHWIDEDLRRRSVAAVSMPVAGMPYMQGMTGMPGMQGQYPMPNQQFGGIPGMPYGAPQGYPQQQIPQQFGAGLGGPQPSQNPYEQPHQQATIGAPVPVTQTSGFGGAPPVTQFPTQSGFGGAPTQQPPFDVPPQQPVQQYQQPVQQYQQPPQQPTQPMQPQGGFGGFGGAPPVAQFPTQQLPQQAPQQQPTPHQQQFGGFGGGAPQIPVQQFQNPLAGTADASIPTGTIPAGVPGGIPVQQFPSSAPPQHVQQHQPPVQQPPVQQFPQQPPVQQPPVQQFQQPQAQQPPVQQPQAQPTQASNALEAAKRALGR